ncbi:MAG TPA: hypothetical protein VM662_13455, partial [Sphingomonas sp.]|nr:hypothetical protein [Sphingomonas sp.]
WMGDFAAAEQDLAAFTELAEINALGPYMAAALGFRGELAIQRGHTGEALVAVENSLSRLRAARYELLTTPFVIALVRGFILDARLAEACDLVDATLASCESRGERFALPELIRLKAQVLRLSGAQEQASRALLDEALALSQQQGAHAWALKVATDLRQPTLATGEIDPTRHPDGVEERLVVADDQKRAVEGL